MKGFSFYAVVSASVAAAVAVVVALVPVSEDARGAAWLGVGLATLSGVIALLLKRRAMSSADGLESLKGGVKTMGMVMVVRAVLLGTGLVWVARHSDGAFGFVVGFFAVYLGQQWLEIKYLLTEQKRRTLSKVETP